MPIVLFQTPGLLDLTAIKTFGVNAKPNTKSPIGFFGTGLKYAIAVLMRHKIDVRLYVGSKHYYFKTVKDTFREKEFDFIDLCWKGLMGEQAMRLPFTTELGKHWELWMAFRELYSNTLDENGHCWQPSNNKWNMSEDDKRRTTIVVAGEEFAKVFEERHKHFLLGASRENIKERESCVEVRNEPSKHVYYRGMRIMDLPRESLVTYNILAKIDLTEDRTAKYAWQVESVIRDYISACNDKELITKVLTAPESTYEHYFDYKDMHHTPGLTFQQAVTEARTVQLVRVNPSAETYVRNHSPEFRAAVQKEHWTETFIRAVTERDWMKYDGIIAGHEDELITLLKAGKPKEQEVLVEPFVPAPEDYASLNTDEEEIPF